MKVTIGISRQADTLLAAKEVWEQVKAKTGKEKIALALLFSSIDLSTTSLLKIIKGELDNTPLIGCSSGAIITDDGIYKHAVILILISGEGIELSVAAVRDIKTKTALSAGRELAESLLQGFSGSHRELGIFFCDGLIEEGSKLLLGLQEKFGRSFPLVGASASDNLRFSRTYLYYNQELLSDAAVGILLGGRLSFGLGIKHGWKPLGKFRTVTESYGNFIKKIDGRPAVNIYQDYFAKDISQLKKELKYLSVFYPIGLYLEGEEEYLLRNILSIEESGSLVCQGDIPPGSQIRLMIGTQESCLAASRQAAQEAKESLAISRLGLQKKDALIDIVFVFDSASRYTLLKRKASQELENIREVMGEGVPIVGFYTYGEQAPLKAMSYQGQAHFHNQTISILSLGG